MNALLRAASLKGRQQFLRGAITSNLKLPCRHEVDKIVYLAWNFMQDS